MSYRTKTVEVDIELDDFDDDELIDELQDRGFIVCKETVLTKEQERLLHDVYLDYVDNKSLNKSVKALLDELYMYVPLRSV